LKSSISKDHFSSGQVRGLHLITERNVSGYQFLGIPYAQPPIANLRYRKPAPVKKWENILDATKFRQSCLWNSSETSNDADKMRMSEDCLFMNVLTNKRCLVDGECAVIFYIHGGGYRYDTPSLFSTQFLIDNFLTHQRSVVFVMPAYRFGSFGFLNLSPHLTTSAVKNIGFLDLIKALQWVQREIKHFGGDAKNVTIMGHSSGGTTVNFLTMSPMAKGLFVKAIVMSGGGTVPLPFDKNHMASVQLARAANCADDDTDFKKLRVVEKVLKCLRAIDAKRLIVLQRRLEDKGYTFMGPCIDGPGGVLPQGIVKLRKQRHPIALLIGSTAQEFSDTAFVVQPDGRTNKSLVWRVCMQAVAEMAFKNKLRTTADCFMEYLDPSRAPHVFDDISIFVSSALSSEDVSSAGGVSFLYDFQYRFVNGAFNFSRLTLPTMTPQHTEDLVYVLGLHKGAFTAKDEIIREKYSQLFVNFVKTGDPSIEGEPKWVPFTATRSNFFVVNFDANNHMPGMSDHYHERALKLWNGTALRHSGGTFDPVSERESLRFDVRTYDASMNFSDMTSLSNVHTLDQLARISAGNIQVLQDTLPDVLMNTATERALMSTTTPDQGKWNVYFWIAVIVIVVLAIALLITCALLCYNRGKRREYERIT
uniref:Carboxylic ester hydrolase n=1 Tax=Toxocara canis TaxID=6265 RepID=A0A183UKG0_TOXCA